ncbi:hypothetical protein DENSPDRAFT_166239 [Dentipellis sp. KUC8613]|nr:hypothetical protein DENSPDRAFT_166239 [Dentipellis sp. KUC8613]
MACGRGGDVLIHDTSSVFAPYVSATSRGLKWHRSVLRTCVEIPRTASDSASDLLCFILLRPSLTPTGRYRIILKFVLNTASLDTTNASSTSRHRLRPASMSTCGTKNYRITIAALWAESILYGLYTILFAGSVYILAFQRPKRSYLATSIVLYVSITASMILRLMQINMTPRSTANSYLVDGVGYSCSSGPQSSPEILEALMIDLTNTIIDAANTLAQYDPIFEVNTIALMSFRP